MVKFGFMMNAPGSGALLRNRSGHKDLKVTLAFETPEPEGEATEDEAARALEDALLRQAAEVDRATAARADFIAHVSHDIRTPLTAILGYSERLSKRTDLPADALVQIERVLAGSEALLAMVDNLSDLSRLESGKAAVSLAPADVAKVLQDVIVQLAPDAQSRGLPLELGPLSALPPRVMIDAVRLKQVLVSIIGERLKAAGGGPLSLTAAFDAVTERLKVIVESSSGPRELYLPVLKAAVCHALLGAMGGEMVTVSRMEGGVAVHVDIDAPLAGVAGEYGLLAREDGLAGLKVLVVDDHATNRELAGAVLSAFGADVVEAADGAEALERLAGETFSAVLLDLRMPGLDGFEVLKQLRAQHGPNVAVPVLAFSADGLESAAETRSAFNGRVTKPIRAENLVVEVTRVAR